MRVDGQTVRQNVVVPDEAVAPEVRSIEWLEIYDACRLMMTCKCLKLQPINPVPTSFGVNITFNDESKRQTLRALRVYCKNLKLATKHDELP